MHAGGGTNDRGEKRNVLIVSVDTGGAGPRESSKTSKTSAKHAMPQRSALPGRPPEGPGGGARGALIFLSLFSLKKSLFSLFWEKRLNYIWILAPKFCFCKNK